MATADPATELPTIAAGCKSSSAADLRDEGVKGGQGRDGGD